MQAFSAALLQLVRDYVPRLQAIDPGLWSIQPAPGKWSKKELMGHLVDSAQNNIRRFIVAQYEELPTIVYDQDLWVEANHYQSYEAKELIDLWLLLNKQLCTILYRLPEDLAQRKCQTQALHTIEWLAGDYRQHLLHHLHQVLEWEPIPYP